MAPPTVTVNPASVTLPATLGASVDVVFTATDPDSAAGSGTVQIVDQQGNTVNAFVSITFEDTLTFANQGTDLPNVASAVVNVTATSMTVRYTVV